jgi:hypothetical protein
VPGSLRIMCPPTILLGAKNMNMTSRRSFSWWQFFLALGAILLCGSALAQDACSLQCSNKEAAWCDGSEMVCPFSYQACMQQCEGSPSHPAVVGPPPPLPCQIAQNALRPCTSQAQASVPTGVDASLVGTWEIVTPTPAGTARWVWEIYKNGTYSFHAEGPGAAPAHSGTFAAAKGHYILNSTTTTWNDTGTYQLTDSLTLVATGKLGTGTWHRVQSKVTSHGQSQPITIRK